MNTSLVFARTSAGWLLTVVWIAFSLQPASGGPPIELVIEDCAAEELPLEANDTDLDDYGELSWTAADPYTGCQGECCGRHVCCPIMEEVTEEKSCWNVTCEKVCVPAFRLPWEPGGSGFTLFSWLGRHDTQYHCGDCVADGETGNGCVGKSTCCGYPPKCGSVRYVSVLEAESYEVTTCQCRWEIRRLPSCNTGCCVGDR